MSGISDSRPTQSLLEKPVDAISTQTARLIPTRIRDVNAASADRTPPYAVRPDRVDLAPSLTHSGHWKPTAAECMQSGQIGRPHRWHEM